MELICCISCLLVFFFMILCDLAIGDLGASCVVADLSIPGGVKYLVGLHGRKEPVETGATTEFLLRGRSFLLCTLWSSPTVQLTSEMSCRLSFFDCSLPYSPLAMIFGSKS
ncbi:hypothetical protein B0T20DRAFT_54926 [Sordaria brevicollis]|uniref:Secreted protein n=1 Tax=Sordaria brevicollis TaxID=83679 RepID=A0AAE0P2R3_SORBR|nr:hypothetical protein B0T20DRAFT_54926 [Sordaria brevicollis]